MLSYKMDFSSCNIMPGFGKSSHIINFKNRVGIGFKKKLQGKILLCTCDTLFVHDNSCQIA